MNRAEVRRRQAGEISNIITLAAILILGHRAGSNGITYMTVAVGVYAMLWIMACGNLSDTLGRLLRGRRNKGQYKNVENMRKNAMILQLVLGLAGSFILLLFSGEIAEGIFKLQYSSLIMAAISPVIFFRAVSSVLMGYFQGEGSEIPTAAAGLLRPLFILGFGILFSGILGDYGDKAAGLLRQDNFSAMYRGVGIALAVCLAEIFVVLFLAVLSKMGGFSRKRTGQEGVYNATESPFDCIKCLCIGRWIQAATAVLVFLPLLSGLFLYGRSMEDEAVMVLEYSTYAGGYLVLCTAAVALDAALILPVIARLFIALRKNEHRFARTVFQSGMHICLVNSIFISVFVAVMGEQIAELLCGENADAVLPMLRGGSSAIVFAVLSYYFARFLQTAGKKNVVLLAVGMADIMFIVTVLLTNKAGILSLVYGGVTGTFMLCMVLGVFACGQMRLKVNWIGIIVIPAAAGGAAGLAGMLIGRIISPHMNELVTLLVVFVIASAVYWGTLILFRNFKDQELDVIPGGKLISSLKQMMHID